MGGPANNLDISTPVVLLNGATPFNDAAAAGTYLSADIPNLSHAGLMVYINITALTGTGPQLVVTIQGKDPVSGQYFTLLASAALTATGFTRLLIYPGVAATANFSDNDVLPPTWRIQAVVSGTTPTVTATIGFAELY